MKYKLQSGSPHEFILLPEKAIAAINSASETDLKILILISKYLSKSPLDEEELIKNLSEYATVNAITSALAFWRGAGVIINSENTVENTEIAPVTHSKQKLDAEEAPFYTAKDLSDAAENNPDYKNLVLFTEQRLKKVLNESELARLYSFLDYYKMPASVVMLSVEDCASRGKTSLRYITKQLNDFESNGAVTYEKAEELLKKRRDSQDYEHYVRNMFGIGDRKLVPKEKNAIETWKEVWHFGRDMLDIAYEKTVNAAKTPSISYMDKILKSWHENGVTTPEEIDQKSNNNSADAPKSYDLDDFFEAAVSKKKKKS